MTTYAIELLRTGDSVSAPLPADLIDRLHWSAGDTVLAVETERGILLTPRDSEVGEELTAASRVADRYRDALRELAR